jgi:predicted XRE-type DNA-binding protein
MLVYPHFQPDLKAALARELCAIMEGWSQDGAASMLGLRQQNMSLLRRGELGIFSINRLLRLIASRGYNLEIVLREMPRKIGRPRPEPTVRVTRYDRFGAQRSAADPAPP